MPRTKRHPGSIRRRGDSWQVRLFVGGEYHGFSVRGTRTDAENFATSKAAELERHARRAAEGLPAAPRFSRLLAEFKRDELPTLSAGTRRSYNDSFKVFAAFFDGMGDPTLDRIGRRDVKRYVSWRRTHRVAGHDAEGRVTFADAGGVSLHTVARDLRVLSRLFNFAVDLEYIDANPCARIRPPKADPRAPVILTPDQLEQLLAAAAAHPMLHMWIVLLAETGLRSLSEALHLEWADVDLAGGFLHVRSAPGRRTKTGRSRWVPMTPRLRAALHEHAARFRMKLYAGRRSPYVFHHINGKAERHGQRIQSLRKAFDNAAERAGMPDGFRPHDLRHRRVTSWLAEGRPAALVQEAMGHASFQTTALYKHLAREHLQALVQDAPSHGSASDMDKSMDKRG